MEIFKVGLSKNLCNNQNTRQDLLRVFLLVVSTFLSLSVTRFYFILTNMAYMKYKANLIIYTKAKDGDIIFFLSRRSKTAKTFSDYYSFWGGGIEEGEIPAEAMKHELKEKLNFTPEQYEYLNEYATPGATKFIFYTEAEKSFVDNLKIHESQYGKCFTLNEVKSEERIIKEDKRIIEVLHGKIQFT